MCDCVVSDTLLTLLLVHVVDQQINHVGQMEVKALFLPDKESLTALINPSHFWMPCSVLTWSGNNLSNNPS